MTLYHHQLQQKQQQEQQQQQQMQQRYQQCNIVLERPSNHSPWGMTLSFQKQTLLVNDLCEDWIRPWTKYAVRNSAFLKPGDIILSLNGRPSSTFMTLSTVTEYIKQCRLLCLVVLRIQKVTQYVKQVLHSIHPVNPSNTFNTINTINPVFNIPFDPSNAENSEDGFRANEYLTPIHSNTFFTWLATRKNKWKSRRRSQPGPRPITIATTIYTNGTNSSINQIPLQPRIIPEAWKNLCFRDNAGAFLSYDDNWDTQPDEQSRAQHFLTTIHDENFEQWLMQRKKMWTENYQPYTFDDTKLLKMEEQIETDSPLTIVNHDFWSCQGYFSFHEWQLSSKTKWKLKYSWNIRKRKQIRQESEEVVAFPSSDNDGTTHFDKWLSVRKNQWRIQRRKRQRRFELDQSDNPPNVHVPDSPRSIISLSKPSSTSGDMIHIDALLEEDLARKRLAKKARQHFDVTFLFDARLGACDDVIAHCLHFLHPSQHGILLSVSKTTSRQFKERSNMWRQLCPTKWSLPRKPRKPWHEMYIGRMRKEEEDSRKRSDEILNRAAMILFKGDHLQKVEKLIHGAQKSFGFDINYSSGVICERNAILNLAVIHRRQKIVKWLLETKERLDIETSDRGGFTPLMNAAWAGDRMLVRLLLGKGCDRAKIGTGHYTQPLALPDFKGLTPEGWAVKKDHTDIATLIRLGL